MVFTVTFEVRDWTLTLNISFCIILERPLDPFEDKSSDHFQDRHTLKLHTNFDFNLTSLLGGVMNLNV